MGFSIIFKALFLKAGLIFFKDSFVLVSVAFSNLGMLYERTADNSVTSES